MTLSMTLLSLQFHYSTAFPLRQRTLKLLTRHTFCARLRDRERGRDWSALDKTYRNRSWSADSYTGEKFVPPRKPGSPAYLPKLENRPASVDSDYEHDLKRGNLKVIPPLPAGEQHGVSRRYMLLNMARILIQISLAMKGRCTY